MGTEKICHLMLRCLSVFTDKRLEGTLQQNSHFLQVLNNIVKYCQTSLACLAKTKYKMRTRICGAAAGKCED